MKQRKLTRAALLIVLAIAGIAASQVDSAFAAIIDNGIVQLGINDTGNLDVPGTVFSRGLVTMFVGLRYIPTNGEALAPGCLCEGWGVANADAVTGTFSGYVDLGVFSDLLAPGLTLQSAMVTVMTGQTKPDSSGSAFKSIVTAGPGRVRVTHDFKPSASPNLYQIDVTIENVGTTSIGDLRYRRVMDWDVPPTTFNEWVNIHVGTAANLVRATTDGFQSANPLVSLSPVAGSPATTLTPGSPDYFGGPADQGSLFDFAFGSLAPGGVRAFRIYYGAAGNLADAMTAINAVGAQVYSLGIANQLTTSGNTPLTTDNVFIFAAFPATTVTVSSSASSSVFGQPVTLTATVAGVGTLTPTGTVEFFDGTTSLGTASLIGGTASITTSSLSAGTHSITAVYSGDSNFAGGTSVVAQVVVTVPTSLVLSRVGPTAYTATLTRSDLNTGLVGATITFAVDDTTVASGTTGTGGVATFTFNPSGLAAGNHTVQAFFAQSDLGGVTFLASQSNTLEIHVPTITNVSPNILFQFQTADVTVTGTQFLPNPTVGFGTGTQVNSVTVVNATTLIANVTALSTAFSPAPPPPYFCHPLLCSPPTLSAPFFLPNDVTLTNSDGGATTKSGAFTVVRDSDGDGVADNFNFSSGTFDFTGISTALVPTRTGTVVDNCPATANQSQRDTDLDGIGDLCDVCPNQNPNPSPGGSCTVPGGSSPIPVQIQTSIVTTPILPLGDFYVRVNVTFPPGNYLFFPALPPTVFFSVLDTTTNTQLTARYVEYLPILIPDDVQQQSSTTTSITTTAVINVGALYPDGLPPGHQLQLQTYYDSHVQVEDPTQLQVFCPAATPTCTPPPLLMARTQTVTTLFTVQSFSTPTVSAQALVVPSTWDVTWAQGATGVVDVYIGNLPGFDATSIPPSTVLLNGLASPISSGIVAASSNPILAGFTGNVLHLQFSQADAGKSLIALLTPVPSNTQVSIQLTGHVTSDGTPTGALLALFRASSTIAVRNDTLAIIQINSLINFVNSLSISSSLKNTLTNKLGDVRKLVINGNIPGACTELHDFINFVNSKIGKGLTSGQAAQLIGFANQILATLGCS